jgi:hypothetical protein
MILHRWIGVEYNLSASAIMITDIFIIGLAMMNATPAIRSGQTIAMFCVFVGVINHFYPSTFWFGSLLLAGIIFTALVTDGLKEWNRNSEELSSTLLSTFSMK